MTTPVHEATHLPLLIGCVALLLLGTAGLAAVKAWPSNSPDVAALADAEDDAPTRVTCAECGVVASLREIAQGAGAAKSGAYQTSKSVPKSYEVTVRMQNGSMRTFVAAPPVQWRTGERVMLIGGAPPPLDISSSPGRALD